MKIRIAIPCRVNKWQAIENVNAKLAELHPSQDEKWHLKSCLTQRSIKDLFLTSVPLPDGGTPLTCVWFSS